MSVLLRPLLRRRVWVVFAAILLAVLVVVVLRPGSLTHGTRVLSGVLLALGFAAFVAGAVSALSSAGVFGYDLGTLAGLDRDRRKRIARAVRQGRAGELSDADLALAQEYAADYVQATPPRLSWTLLIVAGAFFQSLSRLVEGEGGVIGALNVAEVVVFVVACGLGLPLQVRWLRRASDVASGRASSLRGGQAPSQGGSR